MDTKAEYRKQVNEMGKKEFTFLKMQEYGFWPSNQIGRASCRERV